MEWAILLRAAGCEVDAFDFHAFGGKSSFPSGHTLNSTVFLGLAVILLLPLIHRRASRIASMAGAMLLALAIGWSRIYLGYHWTTDVIASWLLALAILVGAAAATRFAPSGRARSRTLKTV